MAKLFAPWTDCKVAFSIERDEGVWRHWGAGAATTCPLPPGWELSETDWSGCRGVVVFRVEGVPLAKDGLAVKRLLRQIGAMRASRAP